MEPLDNCTSSVWKTGFHAMTVDTSSWLNRHRVRSTTVVSISLYMLWDMQTWGKLFASTSQFSGMETAAILAAVQAPAALLAGWAFKIFQENKSI